MTDLNQFTTQDELDKWVRDNILAFTKSEAIQDAVYKRRYEIIKNQIS
jgi:hypothetical protein